MSVIQIPGAKKYLSAGLSPDKITDEHMDGRKTIKIVSKVKRIKDNRVGWTSREVEATEINALAIIDGGKIVGYMNFKRPHKIFDGWKIDINNIMSPMRKTFY